MRIFAVLFLTASICFCSCSPAAEKSTRTVKQEPALPHTGVDVDARFEQADSTVFVFYDDPFTQDSLRYTRYYKQYESTASSYIKPMQAALQLPFTRLEKVKPCRSEGKLWVFAKGKVFQTVYFAFTKSGCAFIYFIKDGFFYYMDIQQPFINTLLSAKTLAKAPE